MKLSGLAGLALGGLLPALARAQPATPPPATAPAVAAPAALPPAATNRQHYWAAVEVGSSTLGALAGKIVKGRAGLFTTSVSLALLRAHTFQNTGLFLLPTTADDQRQTTVGVPVQVQGYLVGLQKCGLGLTATLDLNLVRTSASLGLALALGYLPTRRPPLP